MLIQYWLFFAYLFIISILDIFFGFNILLDMDGVLIDSEQFYEKRRYKYLKIKVINKQEGLNFIGSNEIAIWESLVPSHWYKREELKFDYREYRKNFLIPYKELENLSDILALI